jgi:hypothetical protein
MSEVNSNKETEDLGEGLGALFGGLFKAIQEAERKYDHKPQFPREIAGVKVSKAYISGRSGKVGSLVKVRPCGKEYNNETYLGIYIGDLAIDGSAMLNRDTNEIEVKHRTNPAMFVPKLKKLIFGCESYWTTIKSEKDFDEITDTDIDNVWYVKMMKEMWSKEQQSNPTGEGDA